MATSIFDRLAEPLAALTGRTTDKLQATVARLATEHDKAGADADKLNRTWHDILLERAAEGLPLDDATVAKAKNAAAAAQDKTSALAAALATAKARLSAAQAEDARANEADRWRDALAVAEERHADAQQVAADLEKLGTSYRKLIASNEKLYAALPAMPDPTAALLSKDAIEIAVRYELQNGGAGWEKLWPWGKPNIPRLMPKFDDALLVLRRWAEPK